MRTLKVLGFLLTYPSAQTIEVLDECREILAAEKWLPSDTLSGLGTLMDYMQATDLLDLQEEYVALFDRTPSLCLHLFEHVHGDSRDRGQAMVDLSNVYEEAGLIINTKEIPDFLPLFLEYLSIIDQEEARGNLDGIINITAALAKRLKNRKSKYEFVFNALEVASNCKPDELAIQKAMKAASGEMATFEEIDQEWEEQNAFENSQQTTGVDMDGNSDTGCPIAEEMLARMNIPKAENNKIDKTNNREEA